ncbi:MAG TPA: hypothetical protein VGG04_06005 [Candidatus Sulfotelmatobacter sp.]|jgi:hypothetical protein
MLPWIVGAFLFYPDFLYGQKDAASIIQQSSVANDRDWAASPQFDDSERDRNKDGDRTYAVTMIDGSPCEKLIAVNGRPLDRSAQQQAQEKYDKLVSERKQESAEQRSKRIAKYQADRNRDETMIRQLTVAFDFRLEGGRTFNGHNVFVIKATPRRGYKPPDRDSEVLTGMEGTLWVDKKTFQWVKVEAHVIHPVRIEGFLAQVEPGTRFELEKRPVSSDVWLPSHYSMRSNARVMFLFSHHGQEEEFYSNYHRAADSSEAH